MSAVRPAFLAGTFYPADPVQLQGQIDLYLGAAEVPAGGAHPPKILIAPHGAYAYSGAVAAHAYALLAPWRETVRRVVVVGDAHRACARGIVLTASAAFETPFGAVGLDFDAVAHAAEIHDACVDDELHRREHAIEVQLPFLQAVLADFALVPMLVGLTPGRSIEAAFDRLWDGDETVFVVSTDLSHYLAYDTARTMDRATVDRILALDAGIDNEEACCAVGVNAAIAAARRHGLRARLLALGNSGDSVGGRAQVVGYGALAFERP